MKRNYYILKNGVLRRKENTVYFISKDEKVILPINKIRTIYAYGRLSFTSGVVSYLGRSGVCIHFYNSHGYYEGSFYPRKKLLSGDLLVKQVKHYLEEDLRLSLAKRFIEGSARNIIKNLKNYSKDVTAVEEQLLKLEDQTGIPHIMNIEGKIRQYYYSKLDEIFPEEFKLCGRKKRPPSNMTNSLISFGNSLLYGTIISEIYNTQLNPTVSYLHEPSERRFSLALDIAEVFKPFLVDRVILKLINKRIINASCFRKEVNYVLLNDKGRRVFLEEYEKKLQTTIKHKALRKNVSYRRLIRLELYKLIKHFIGMREYRPFVIWW